MLTPALLLLAALALAPSASAAPNLQASFSQPSVDGFAGANLQVTARVQNTGDTASSDASLAFDFGRGFVRMKSADWPCTGRVSFGQVSCALDTIEPGQYRDVVLQFASSSEVDRVVYARAYSASEENFLDNVAQAQLRLLPADTNISVKASPSLRRPRPGQAFSVEVSISNATIVKAQDSLACITVPKGLRVVRSYYGEVSAKGICWDSGDFSGPLRYTYSPVFRASKRARGRLKGKTSFSARNASKATDSWSVKVSKVHPHFAG